MHSWQPKLKYGGSCTTDQGSLSLIVIWERRSKTVTFNKLFGIDFFKVRSSNTNISDVQ